MSTDAAPSVAAAAAAASDSPGGQSTESVEGSSERKSETKRKKSNRLTTANKEKMSLDKTVSSIQASGESYYRLVHRIDRWLQQNSDRAVTLLTDFNADGVTEVTFGRFKAAMHDLAIPCTAVELHLLCNLLDFEQKELIDVNRLKNGLSFVWSHEADYVKEVRPALTLTNEKYAHCSKGGCTMAQWNGEPYKIVTPSEHVGHFSAVVPTHTTVFHLTKVIGDQTSIIMPHAVIFTDKSRDPKSILAPDLTLEECGFEGGSSNFPRELMLFYDYAVQLKDCPLLLCDHYLANNNAKSLKHRESFQKSSTLS